jgi:GGDEF domain-containing protein
LDLREAAEEALAAAMERGGPSYAALFVVDRLHVVNAQFGYSTGDRVLRAFCSHLKSFLSPQDQLFRWTGPAFVGLLDRGDDSDEVQADIEPIASFKLEAAVQIGNRSILLPVNCASVLVPLAEASTLADVTTRLDAFTSERVRH